MNDSIIKGKWDEFKGEVRKLWGDISENDLESTKGNLTAIGGLVQQKYGTLKDDVKSQFDTLVQRYGDKAVSASGQAKDALKDSVRKDAAKDANKH